MKRIITILTTLLFASAAFADNDGVSRLGFNDAPIPGVYIDVADGSIDRDELSTDVKDELDGLRDDTDTNTTNIASNTSTLSLHTTQIAQQTSVNDYQNGRLDSLEYKSYKHSAALSNHAAILDNHSRTLDIHSKRLAISMAMPDTWLSDKENYAIAGNIGGFEDEGALGFAAIVRIDDNLSFNAKVGSDFRFDEFGWSVGARAGF